MWVKRRGRGRGRQVQWGGHGGRANQKTQIPVLFCLFCCLTPLEYGQAVAPSCGPAEQAAGVPEGVRRVPQQTSEADLRTLHASALATLSEGSPPAGGGRQRWHPGPHPCGARVGLGSCRSLVLAQPGKNISVAEWVCPRSWGSPSQVEGVVTLSWP